MMRVCRRGGAQDVRLPLQVAQALARRLPHLPRAGYGPVLKAFAALDPQTGKALEADLHALLDVARDGTVVVPGEYLEVVVTLK